MDEDDSMPALLDSGSEGEDTLPAAPATAAPPKAAVIGPAATAASDSSFESEEDEDYDSEYDADEDDDEDDIPALESDDEDDELHDTVPARAAPSAGGRAGSGPNLPPRHQATSGSQHSAQQRSAAAAKPNPQGQDGDLPPLVDEADVAGALSHPRAASHLGTRRPASSTSGGKKLQVDEVDDDDEEEEEAQKAKRAKEHRPAFKPGFLDKANKPSAARTSPTPSTSARPSTAYSNVGVGVKEDLRPAAKSAQPAAEQQNYPGPDPKYSREEGPAALRHKPHGGAANQTAPQQQLSDDDDGPPPLVDDEGVEPPKSKGRKPPEASRDDGDGEEDMPDLVSDNEDPNKQHRGRAMPDPAAARESAAAPGKAEKASKKAAEGKSKADKEARAKKERKEKRKAAVVVEEPETVSRSDFANDEAWQAHVAKEREERERLRREAGLVEDTSKLSGDADGTLGYCCARPGNDTDCVCDEAQFRVKESHKRYFLHCTKGCTMLFHDKCWRPFVEALLVLRPDFDKSFKNLNKENKPKPHRCLTDCCAGYIDRVYIRQGGDGPGAKVLYHYDMYTMDQATRQLIEAEAAKRRKRPGAASVEDAADLQNHGNAAKKSRKGAKDKDKEKERAKEKEKEEAKVAKEKERAGRKEAVATAAAAVMAAAQVAAEPAQAAVKAAPKGISIVNRAKFVPKEDPMEVAEEPEPVRLPPDDALLRPLRRSGTGTGEPDEQPAPPAPPPPADDGADAMDTGNDEVAELVTGSAAAAAAAKKKKKKGMTVNLDVFLAAGAAGATPEPRAESDDELPIRQEKRQQGRRRRQDVQIVQEAAAYEAPVHAPAPAAPRAYDFPSLELASELAARRGTEAEPVRDYVMEALSSLKLSVNEAKATRYLLLECLDVRWLDENTPYPEGYLRTFVTEYAQSSRTGGEVVVLGLTLFRDQQVAAVELTSVPCAVQAAIALSTNKVLGRKRLAVAYLTEYPTDEVLARHLPLDLRAELGEPAAPAPPPPPPPPPPRPAGPSISLAAAVSAPAFVPGSLARAEAPPNPPARLLAAASAASAVPTNLVSSAHEAAAAALAGGRFPSPVMSTSGTSPLPFALQPSASSPVPPAASPTRHTDSASARDARAPVLSSLSSTIRDPLAVPEFKPRAPLMVPGAAASASAVAASMHTAAGPAAAGATAPIVMPHKRVLDIRDPLSGRSVSPIVSAPDAGGTTPEGMAASLAAARAGAAGAGGSGVGYAEDMDMGEGEEYYEGEEEEEEHYDEYVEEVGFEGGEEEEDEEELVVVEGMVVDGEGEQEGHAAQGSEGRAASAASAASTARSLNITAREFVPPAARGTQQEGEQQRQSVSPGAAEGEGSSMRGVEAAAADAGAAAGNGGAAEGAAEAEAPQPEASGPASVAPTADVVSMEEVEADAAAVTATMAEAAAGAGDAAAAPADAAAGGEGEGVEPEPSGGAPMEDVAAGDAGAAQPEAAAQPAGEAPEEAATGAASLSPVPEPERGAAEPASAAAAEGVPAAVNQPAAYTPTATSPTTEPATAPQAVAPQTVTAVPAAGTLPAAPPPLFGVQALLAAASGYQPPAAAAAAAATAAAAAATGAAGVRQHAPQSNSSAGGAPAAGSNMAYQQLLAAGVTMAQGMVPGRSGGGGGGGGGGGAAPPPPPGGVNGPASADAQRAVWMDYDSVQLTICSNETTVTYLRHPTVQLDTVYFLEPSRIATTERTALLLYNIDKNTILGMWCATNNDGNKITWQVVKYYPEMPKAAFQASAAAAIFSLPPLTTALRCTGEDARTVIRAFVEHARKADQQPASRQAPAAPPAPVVAGGASGSTPAAAAAPLQPSAAPSAPRPAYLPLSLAFAQRAAANGAASAAAPAATAAATPLIQPQLTAAVNAPPLAPYLPAALQNRAPVAAAPAAAAAPPAAPIAPGVPGVVRPVIVGTAAVRPATGTIGQPVTAAAAGAGAIPVTHAGAAAAAPAVRPVVVQPAAAAPAAQAAPAAAAPAPVMAGIRPVLSSGVRPLAPGMNIRPAGPAGAPGQAPSFAGLFRPAAPTPPPAPAPAPPPAPAPAPAPAAAAAPSWTETAPQQPVAAKRPPTRLACPLCQERLGNWAKTDCGHMGPCADCCPTLEDLKTKYTHCGRCGKPVDLQFMHKAHT